MVPVNSTEEARALAFRSECFPHPRVPCQAYMKQQRNLRGLGTDVGNYRQAPTTIGESQGTGHRVIDKLEMGRKRRCGKLPTMLLIETDSADTGSARHSCDLPRCGRICRSY